MPQSIDSEQRALGARPIDHIPAPAVRVGLGLVPAWILLIQLVAFPSMIEPLGNNPPAVAGLPLGLLTIVAALVVTIIGAVRLRRSSSTTLMVLWLAACTAPSAAVVLVAPAAIGLMQLMGT